MSTGGLVFSAELPCGAQQVPTPPGCDRYPEPPATIAQWQHKGMLRLSFCTPGHPARCAKSRLYKFLNSGGYAGSKRSVLSMLEAVLRYRRSRALDDWGGEEDQLMLNRWFLEHGKAERATLDYRGRLFLTLARFHPAAVRQAENAARVRFVLPRWSNRPACFLHFNGGGTWRENIQLEHLQQRQGLADDAGVAMGRGRLGSPNQARRGIICGSYYTGRLLKVSGLLGSLSSSV